MTDTAPLAALMGHIDRCLALHGQDGFAPAYLELLEALGADQVMVFSYGPDHAACLMSRNFREARLGKRLAADYLDGWFRLDPLYAAALAQAAGEVAVRSVTPRDESMTPDYRARFYDAPGLGGKLSVLAAGERLRLVVNLYHREVAGWSGIEAVLPVVGRLALLHFERRVAGAVPDALMALSERERAVCLGVLEGKKAELIAHDLGVAPTSVVTYRRRAYGKLGISSRGELFAICRG